MGGGKGPSLQPYERTWQYTEYQQPLHDSLFRGLGQAGAAMTRAVHQPPVEVVPPQKPRKIRIVEE